MGRVTKAGERMKRFAVGANKKRLAKNGNEQGAALHFERNHGSYDPVFGE